MVRNLFLVGSAALWASIFGYVATLLILTARRMLRRAGATADELPPITLVVPVRNEERFIAAKLLDLRRTDYPRGLVRTLVVDGGSTDRTVELVEAERARGGAVELMRVPGARGKAEQLNAAFATLQGEIVVVTDVDAALEPSCVRRLVQALRAEPNNAIVGARIAPASDLLEERMHWWLVNSVWWLEGEALGAAPISGVCYAMRRSVFAPLPADCTAEDIRLSLGAGARGLAVRLCRRAVATELRVPQTVGEFLAFRRRRGLGYIYELLRARAPRAPLRWHALRAMRLYHFLAVPPLAALVLAAGLTLCAAGQWRWPVLVGLAFATPAVLALFASSTIGREGRRWWRLGIAAGRLAGLTWLSLLALPRAARLAILQRN